MKTSLIKNSQRINQTRNYNLKSSYSLKDKAWSIHIHHIGLVKWKDHGPLKKLEKKFGFFWHGWLIIQKTPFLIFEKVTGSNLCNDIEIIYIYSIIESIKNKKVKKVWLVEKINNFPPFWLAQSKKKKQKHSNIIWPGG